MVTNAGRVRNPDKQIFEVAVPHLLPHLKEAVNGVADEVAIGRIARDLEWTVSQIIGKAGVRDIQGLTGGVGRIGLRQLAVSGGALWIEAVGTLRVGDLLLGQAEIATGIAIIVDHCRPVKQAVSADKGMISHAILAN